MIFEHTFAFKQKRVLDNSPWLNKNIKTEMRQRDCFLGKARKTNHSEAWSKYRYYRNCASNKIKKA